VTVDLGQVPQKWECPNCPEYAVSFGKPNRFHNCAGLAGLLAPMVPAGTQARVTAHEREDYISGEDVQSDGNGRPVMSVTVERADGSNDTVVFAATAHLRGEA
jgi:hypothetical protein